ncbi:MAG: TerB family tellurite resistance protein [Fluviicola sp.]
MSPSLKEKLSLLSELIKLAKADQELRQAEFDFLYAIAKQLKVSDKDFKRLFDEYIEFTPPKDEMDRIVQFQRLVLMMNVDHHVSEEQVNHIRQIGIRMGLAPRATDEVLKSMKEYENGLIPPEKLISIFKTFHN